MGQKRTLATEAHYSSDHYDEHQGREPRLEAQAFDDALERLEKFDPAGEKALAVIREMEQNRQ